MINKNKLIAELERLLDTEVDPTLFPYQKGNSIRIGKYIVRGSKAKGFYRVFDCESNSQIAETFSKTGALALARNLAKNRNQVETILRLDQDIQKWYNDCVFYRHGMNKSSDETKIDILQTRYDIARDRTEDAKRQLDRFIFS